MWQLNSPWHEHVLRAFIIYLFVFIFIRLIGKKQLMKCSPFDFTLILTLSYSLQYVALGNDHGLAASIITIATLLFISTLVNELTYRFVWFEKLILKQPEVIILHGKVHKRILKKERISEADLFVALREHEIMKTDDVKCAILETDGSISVFKYNSHH